MNRKRKIEVALVVGIVVVVGFGLYAMFAGVGVSEQSYDNNFVSHDAAVRTNDIYAQVASDAVAKYDIASHGGTAMDRCVQAGLVVAAYLQAKDEANYTSWKETQKIDCYLAGVPQ